MNARTGETSFSKIAIASEPSIKIENMIKDFLAAIGDQSYRRGPWASFIQFGQFCYLAGSANFDLHGKRCIDFGCGHERPFTMGSLLYLLGARSVLCTDFAMYSSEREVAQGLFSTLLSLLSEGIGNNAPIHAVSGDESEMRSRIGHFDTKKLWHGDLSGVPEVITFHSGDYNDLPEEEKKFDILHAASVFEHVADLEECLISLRKSISPDGLIVATIDMRDHRLYGGMVDNPWQFMVDGGDVSPGFINKLRYSDVMDLIPRAGFSLAFHDTRTEIPPAAVTQNFLEKYKSLSEKDLTTTELWVALRPV